MKLPLGRGAASVVLRITVGRCSLAWACLQGACRVLPSVHRLCFPQAQLFSCKHVLIFLRWRKSPLKPSSLSSCSFISSFLFTAEVPESAICSQRHSARHFSGMWGHVPPPWQRCAAISPSPLLCAHPVCGRAGHPATPRGVSALPACGAAPSICCHPIHLPSMFGQDFHPDI